MLNNEKITLMTKLSLYEQKYTNKEISTSKYWKSDYIALKMLSSFVLATVGYLLIIALWFLYTSASIIEKLTTTGRFIALVVVLGLLYVIVLVAYLIFSYAFYTHRFGKIRKNLNEYNGDLKTLHRIQELEYDAIIGELDEEGGQE